MSDSVKIIAELQAGYDGEILPCEPILPLLDEFLAERKETRADCRGLSCSCGETLADAFEGFVKEKYTEVATYISRRDAHLYGACIVYVQ